MAFKDPISQKIDYWKWQNQYIYFSGRTLLIFFVLSVLAYTFSENSIIRLIAILIGLKSAIEFTRRGGHYEGYMEGYQSAVDDLYNDN